MREGLQFLPTGAWRENEEGWVARLEEEERKLLKTRRQELMDDPHKQDMVEHLLETKTAPDPP